MTALKSIRWRKPTPEKPPEPPVVDLDKLETALNETSRRAAAQWLGFLSLWAYLFFTTVAVTDYDLLVETPVKLPLIGVELGLFSFFVWTPALFLVVHLYIARKVALLARQAAFYRKQILAQKVAGAHLAARENRLDAFAVTGLLLRFDGGEDQPPDRLLTGFTALTVYVTLFVLPLALYAAFLVYFLAYQHEFTTWWHRVALLLGAGLAVYGAFRAGALTLRRWVAGLSVLLIALVVSPAFVVFTFPGERLHEYSFAEQVFNVAGVYPNRLKPRQPAHLFAEAKKAGKLDEANQLDLAGRDFSGRTLRNTDLSGANLRGARFLDADMQGANLTSAYMQGADLSGVYLPYASLTRAYLQGTNLFRGVLQEADLIGAGLQGAFLARADLQGANLEYAALQGANLINANLQGANLTSTHLLVAEVSEADLQGADLSFANLQGANFSNAHLQGVDLSGASLQEANLSYADLQGAILKNTELWKTKFNNSKVKHSLLSGLKIKKFNMNNNISEFALVDYQYNMKNIIKNKIIALSEFSDQFNDIAETAEIINYLMATTKDETPQSRAVILGAELCQKRGGHFAIIGIIRQILYRGALGIVQLDPTSRGISFTVLQDKILNIEQCPAADGLTDKDIALLAQVVAQEHQHWLWAEAAEWFARAGLGAGAAL